MKPDTNEIEAFALAYRILTNEGVLDSFGHIGVRSATTPDQFLTPRATPPSLDRNVVVLDEPELFGPSEFDINRPWEHFRHKLLADSTRRAVDRGQFGLNHTRSSRNPAPAIAKPFSAAALTMERQL